MKKILICFIIIPFLSISCSAQTSNNNSRSTEKVGGYCDGCEGLYEYGNRSFSAVDTLPGFFGEGEKLKISGTVYKKDGKTPAKDVIVYVYHTNKDGVYPKREGATGWGRQHGYIRGWMKTGADGRYTFYTIKPGSYPARNSPAHIHMMIKEPDINEYYIDDINFKGDPLLSEEDQSKHKAKAGDGVVKLTRKNGLLTAERDIILGLNIENYPK